MYCRGDRASTKLLLCEGNHDVEFFYALCQQHNINDLSFACPDRDKEPGGVNAFRICLRAIATTSDYPNLAKILIVGDKDSSAKAQFVSIQSEVHKSGHPFGVPAKARRFKRSGNKLPAIGILMIPKGSGGCLETLLLPSIYASSIGLNSAAKNALEAFCKSTGINGWPFSKRSKARMRILLTTLYQKNPYLSLAHVWKKPSTANLIPLQGIRDITELAGYLKRI